MFAALLSSMISMTASQAADPRVFAPLEVVDARGVRLGVTHATPGSFTASIVLKFDGLPWGVYIGRDGLQSNRELLYETVDCSGQPYMVPVDAGMLPNVAVNSAFEIFTFDRLATPSELIVGSTETTTGCARAYWSGTTPLVPAILRVRFNDIAQAPFSVRAP